jgi:hypothetical protein
MINKKIKFCDKYNKWNYVIGITKKNQNMISIDFVFIEQKYISINWTNEGVGVTNKVHVSFVRN